MPQGGGRAPRGGRDRGPGGSEVDVTDPKLHVEDSGQGPAVVLLHGFGGSGRNFRPQARALRGRWRVLLPDLRAHGRSEAPEDPAACDEAAYVADVARVLDRAGVRRAVVGGLSMGAAVALAFARAHPGRVRGLVLASYPAAREARGISGIATRFAETLERQGLEAAGAAFVWGPESGLDAAGAALVRQGFLEHRPRSLAAALRGFLASLPPLDALATPLGHLPCPALVVAGERDAGSLPSCRRLATLLPRAELVVVPDAGHVVNLEAPVAFNSALLRFLDALPPEQG